MRDFEYYSASRIKSITDCKKFFYHQYLAEDGERDPGNAFSDMGHALHTALEIWRMNPDRTAAGRKLLVEIFSENFRPGTNHFLFKQGRSILWSLDFNHIIRGDLLGVEYQLDTEIDGFPVKGIVDKIEQIADNEILVTDYKSNKKIEPHLYAHQLAIYDAAIKDQLAAGGFTDIKVTHELYYLRFGKSVEMSFTEKSRDRVLSIFDKVDKIIKQNGHDEKLWPKRKKEGKPCTFCPLKKDCWK